MFTPVPSWLVNVEIGIWGQWMNALSTSGSLATGTLVEFTWAAYTYLCVCVRMYVHICLHTVVKGTYARYVIKVCM